MIRLLELSDDDASEERAGEEAAPSSLGGDQCAHAIVEGIISAMTMKPWVASCQRLP